MIILNVYIKVKDNKEKEFLEITNKMVKESRNENGNYGYEVYKDLDNDCQYLTVEYWKNDQAIEIHNNSKHFTEFYPKVNEFLKEQMVFKKYYE